MKFGFIIDNRKCIGCHACTVACKAEHDIPLGVNRTWVKYIEKGEFPNTRRLFSVMRCNHCADAPCVEICPTGALFTRKDGIVDFDKRRCIGCKSCMQACPYDALYIDPETDTAAKCNYCAHRVDIGLQPACVNVCPVHAIVSGDMDDPRSDISQLLAREQVTARKVEKGTRPNLFYIDGDKASLNPTLTTQSDQYMWSSQLSGVGHFAKYTENRINQTDPEELLNQLTGNENEDRQWISGENNPKDKVLVPEIQSPKKTEQKAKDVTEESARRVYDSPSKGVLWGWEVTTYMWTKAVATGVFLVPFFAIVGGFTAVSESIQWLGLILGLLFLTLTGILLIKDLDQPIRFAYVLLRPQWRSWLVRGGYAITLFGGLLTLGIVVKISGLTTIENIVKWLCAITAMITSIYTAFLFAQAKGRDFWQSPILSLHMLNQSVLAGAAFFAFLSPITDFGQNWHYYLDRIFYIFIALNLLIISVELFTPHATEDSKAVVNMILRGQFKKLFKAGVIIMGNVVPFLLVLVGSPEVLPFIGLFVLVGIYFTEHIWVKAPQLIPLS